MARRYIRIVETAVQFCLGPPKFIYSEIENGFIKIYPEVHKKFFRNILKADILFIANEDKNGIKGYIGAEVFAELVYGLMQKLISRQKIKIILAKMPSSKVQFFEEIKLWLKLGWIKIL